MAATAPIVDLLLSHCDNFIKEKHLSNLVKPRAIKHFLGTVTDIATTFYTKPDSKAVAYEKDEPVLKPLPPNDGHNQQAISCRVRSPIQIEELQSSLANSSSR